MRLPARTVYYGYWLPRGGGGGRLGSWGGNYSRVPSVRLNLELL